MTKITMKHILLFKQSSSSSSTRHFCTIGEIHRLFFLDYPDAVYTKAEKCNLLFCRGQLCPRDPPWLSQCEVSWLDATLAACLLSKVTVGLIFPPVVLLVVVKMLNWNERGGGQVLKTSDPSRFKEWNKYGYIFSFKKCRHGNVRNRLTLILI